MQIQFIYSCIQCVNINKINDINTHNLIQKYTYIIEYLFLINPFESSHNSMTVLTGKYRW